MSGLILSFRSNDVPAMADRLSATLSQQFGAKQIAKGVGSVIDPGEDYLEAIQSAVDKCEALLVVIGPQWSTGNWMRDGDDYDTIAISRALQTMKRVIPILVNGAGLPAELPAAFDAMKRRAGIPITDNNYDSDAAQLVGAVQKFMLVTGQAANDFIAPPPAYTAPSHQTQPATAISLGGNANRIVGGIIALAAVGIIVMFFAVEWLSFSEDAIRSSMRQTMEDSDYVSDQARRQSMTKSDLIDRALDDIGDFGGLDDCGFTGYQMVAQKDAGENCENIDVDEEADDTDETLLNIIEYSIAAWPILAAIGVIYGVLLLLKPDMLRGATLRNMLVLGIVLAIFPFIWGIAYNEPIQNIFVDTFLSDDESLDDVSEERRENIEFSVDLFTAVFESGYPGIGHVALPTVIIVTALGGLVYLGVKPTVPSPAQTG